jgi:hypothetical protein
MGETTRPLFAKTSKFTGFNGENAETLAKGAIGISSVYQRQANSQG